jgi:formiminotetrahydrofolate cyclodeaminase
LLDALKITKFLEKIAAGTAVPGGGSVAALNAALAASLTEMVANLTVGKKAYEAAEKDMREIAARASGFRKKLAKDIDNDADAYNEVLKAFKMAKNTEKEKDRRTRAIQAGFKNAALVPLGVARDALSIMKLTGKVLRKGNKTPS